MTGRCRQTLRKMKNNYTFSEVCNADGYTRISKDTGDWNDNTYVLSYTNKYKVDNKVRIVVKKTGMIPKIVMVSVRIQ